MPQQGRTAPKLGPSDDAGYPSDRSSVAQTESVGVIAHMQAPSSMADLYRLRCHSMKDSGSPAPEMMVQNSQSPSALCPTMNLQWAPLLGWATEHGMLDGELHLVLSLPQRSSCPVEALADRTWGQLMRGDQHYALRLLCICKHPSADLV